MRTHHQPGFKGRCFPLPSHCLHSIALHARSKGPETGGQRNHRLIHTAQYRQIRQAHAGQRQLRHTPKVGSGVRKWSWQQLKSLRVRGTAQLSPTLIMADVRLQGEHGRPQAQYQKKEEAGKERLVEQSEGGHSWQCLPRGKHTHSGVPSWDCSYCAVA